jgi:hypothetical protein
MFWKMYWNPFVRNPFARSAWNESRLLTAIGGVKIALDSAFFFFYLEILITVVFNNPSKVVSLRLVSPAYNAELPNVLISTKSKLLEIKILGTVGSVN